MNTDPRDDALAPAAARLVELARDSFGEMSDEQRARGARALRLRLETGRARSFPRSGGLALAAIGVAIAALASLYIKRSPSNLSVRVDGASLETGGLLQAKTAESTAHFSDGSEVVLSAGGQLHVRSLEEHGAHITLDAGRAHIYVVHQSHTHWEFAAGPFVVDVIGTAFGLSWNNASQELDLQLENGAVKVTGPVLDGALSLRAGQWLSVRQGDVRIRNFGATATPTPTAIGSAAPSVESTPSPTEGAPSAALAPTAFNSAGSVSSAQRADAIRAHRARWPSDLAQGHYALIVSDALSTGLGASLSQSNVDELWALADAARYSRHPELAQSALTAVRQRFASSSQARTAAFYLGRLAEATQDARTALNWFGVYLTEAPNGAYASEALGRKMTLVQRLDGDAAARPIAQSYLLRFATGTYAEAARALAQ
jgi:TolA-binding protein